jgi:ribosomal protein S10
MTNTITAQTSFNDVQKIKSRMSENEKTIDNIQKMINKIITAIERAQKMTRLYFGLLKQNEYSLAEKEVFCRNIVNLRERIERWEDEEMRLHQRIFDIEEINYELKNKIV